MKHHPTYIILILLMALCCLCGLALLIWGATQQGPLPRPGVVLVPPQVHHG